MQASRAAFVALVILVALIVPAVSVPAQVSLEDAIVTAFEINAELRPAPFAGVCDVASCQITSFGSLRGRTTAQMEVTSPNPVTTMRWILDDDLQVRSVTGPGVSFRRDRFYIVLTFNPPLVAGTRLTLTFEYEGRVGSVWDDLILAWDGLLYPTLSSPFGDISGNRAPIKTTVTIPQGYLLASTGTMNRRDTGGMQVYEWQSAPLPYIAVVGGKVGFYQAVERQAGQVPLTVFIRPQYDRFLNQLVDFTGKAAEYYGRILYPFPTGKITMVASPFGRSLLGIGLPSLMMITEDAFQPADPTLNRDSFRLLLVAHEAAHTYFPAETSGKGIGYIWLSEGFAEYLGLLTVEEVMGKEAFARELAEERRGYARVAGQDLPIAAYTWINSGTTAAVVVRYQKGAYVLHMLRHVVGTQTFLNIMKTYATRFRAQSVRVSNFQDVAQEVYGQSLEWFFQEWIYQRVLPDYTIESATSAAAEGGTRTMVRVRNLGTGEMPVDVVFEMDGGEKLTRRATVGSRADATVEVVTPRPVRRVEVDPEKWILQANYTNDSASVR
ncbi:MAG TPA: M1 family aminopeptidase [bacterium]|jgi:aminopeptidase N|nr:M1 family aminopeptidase [bacterium]